MTCDCINYIGIADELPNGIQYFKEELISKVFKRNKNSKQIESIMSVSLDCEIDSIKIINTSTSVSNEGQRLSGKKILVETTLKFIVKYTTNSNEQYMYIFKSSLTKIFYIVVPKEINQTPIEDLVRQKKIIIKPYIEDIYAEVRDGDNIYIRALLLLNLKNSKFN